MKVLHTSIVFIAFFALFHVATVRSDQAEESFKQVDTNGDGKVSADELKAALIKNGVAEDQANAAVRKIFKEVDANKDAYITLEEARKNPIQLPPGK